MSKKRQSNKHLPPRVYHRHGAYFFVNRLGKWHRLGATLREALLAHQALLDVPGQCDTMAALMLRYEAEVIPTKAPSSQATNARELLYLRAFFGQMRPADVRPMHVAQYLDHRGASAPVRANREKALLSHIFSMAMRWGIVDTNPCRGVHRNPERPRERLPSADEIEAFCECCGNDLIRAWVIVKYLTGLRQGDLLELKRSQLKADGIHLTTKKTGYRTIIEWSPDLRAAIDVALMHQRVASVYVFATQRGSRYTPDGFRSVWHKAMQRYEASGGERFREHDIRAATATQAKAQGVDAQKLLGHKAASTTDIYIRRKTVEKVTPIKLKS